MLHEIKIGFIGQPKIEIPQEILGKSFILTINGETVFKNYHYSISEDEKFIIWEDTLQPLTPRDSVRIIVS